MKYDRQDVLIWLATVFVLFAQMKADVTISEQNPMSEQIGAEVYHLHKTNVYAIIKLHQAEADEFEIGVCQCPHSVS